MVATGTVAQDVPGNLKPARDKSTERIDGVVAIIMATGRALVAQEEPEPEYSMLFVWRADSEHLQGNLSDDRAYGAPLARDLVFKN